MLNIAIIGELHWLQQWREWLPWKTPKRVRWR